VRDCADAILARPDPIHVLVNNAGMLASPEDTSDGVERTIQVNLLTQFLFTRLLLPKLRQSNGRVIYVSSDIVARIAPMPEALPLTTAEWNSFNSTSSNKMTIIGGQNTRLYGVSKRYLNQSIKAFTKHLADAGVENVSVVAICPGFIPATNLAREAPWLARVVLQKIIPLMPFAVSLSTGIGTITQAKDHGASGQWYIDHKWEDIEDDPAVCETTWKACCRAVDLPESLT